MKLDETLSTILKGLCKLFTPIWVLVLFCITPPLLLMFLAIDAVHDYYARRRPSVVVCCVHCGHRIILVRGRPNHTCDGCGLPHGHVLP